MAGEITANQAKATAQQNYYTNAPGPIQTFIQGCWTNIAAKANLGELVYRVQIPSYATYKTVVPRVVDYFVQYGYRARLEQDGGNGMIQLNIDETKPVYLSIYWG